MQRSEIGVDLVSKNRFVANSGCCARCEMQRSEIVVTLFLRAALLRVLVVVRVLNMQCIMVR